jgi:transposase InsO family protein
VGMQTKLANDELLMAIWKRKPGKGLIWHTDRGSHYASNSHRALLNEHAIITLKDTCAGGKQKPDPSHAIKKSAWTLSRDKPYCLSFFIQRGAFC